MTSMQKWCRFGAMSVVGVLLAGGAAMTHAQDIPGPMYAAKCRTAHPSGTTWEPVAPLISSATQVGDTLTSRVAEVATRFRYLRAPSDGPEYELYIAVKLSGPAPVGNNAWLPTNVPGIAMVISVNDMPLAPTYDIVVVAKHPLPPLPTLPPELQSRATVFHKKLVLTVPPDQLPSGSGAMVVTGFSPGVEMTLYAITERKGAYSIGQKFGALPSYSAGYDVCVLPDESPYTGSKIMDLGARGGPVVFSNACEVGVTQTKEVSLGAYSLRDFPSQGATTEERPFDITLGKCSVKARPKISFTATHGAVQGKTVLNLDPNADAQGRQAAKGVGIFMMNAATNKRIEFGKSYDMTPMNLDGAAIHLRAAYLRTASNSADMTGGHANGTVEFRINFP